MIKKLEFDSNNDTFKVMDIKIKINEIIEFLNEKTTTVPSLDLDKLAEKYISEEKMGEKLDISGMYGVLGFVDYLKQNGIETNKEGPNENEILAIQNFLLNRATEIDASILESYLSKFNAGVFC